MIKARSTKTLPMGPEFVEACKADLLEMSANGEITIEMLIGRAWWWAREKGVRGWSEATLKTSLGAMDATPDEIANRPEGKPE